MATAHHQQYLHFVFAPKQRKAQIEEPIRERLEDYLGGIVKGQGHHVHAIYAMPDHVHLLVGMKPSQAPSDFIRILKANSSKWINEISLTSARFEWQEGYGLFSHGPESLDKVINYIRTQPEHHKTHSFDSEYRALLKRFNIEFEERYLLSHSG